MNAPVLLIGPQGVGKTRLAEALQEAVGATTLLDPWEGGTSLLAGALAIASDESAAQRAPAGTTIYRVGSREDLHRLLETLSPVCHTCQHYKGRLFAVLDSGCSHPVNTQWNRIEGSHIPPVACEDMRQAVAACGPTGRLFVRAVERRYWPIADVLAGTTLSASDSPAACGTQFPPKPPPPPTTAVTHSITGENP